MHLLELYYANARLNQTGKFIFPCRKGTIPKWTILSAHSREKEKLQLLALSLAGTRCLPHISEYLHVEAAGWTQKTCDMRSEWMGLTQWQRRMLIPILDACRHLLDAFPKSFDPLKTPGLILLDRPSRFCTAKRFPDWVKLMDELLPQMQFVVALTDQAAFQFPHKLHKKRLKIHKNEMPRPSKRKSDRIGAGTILLIDVDGRLPNFALMKLSRYYKEQGRKVILGYKDCCFKGPEAVYASVVFHNHTTDQRIAKLGRYYGESLTLGGSGVDIHRRLPANINNISPDYDFYPELGDRAIGFLTRGCPFRYAFCIVPVKEGQPRQVSDLDTLLAGRRKLILLDDNILSHPNAVDLLEKMACRHIQVNFTQTLDFRMLDRRKAALLRQIKCSNLRFTRSVYHFSLNNTRRMKELARKYKMFGFTPRDNVEFICMYGFNTTLVEDVARFCFLRSLPGAYVFVQQYQPIRGGPPMASIPFFDENADDLIDELVGILFPQNMKSMEKYYRWVSKRYVETFGRLHKNLVDTIFRYNRRGMKGEYIATMAGTRKWSTA